LKSDIEVVNAAFENIKNHARRRKEEAKNLANSFKGLESDRRKTGEEFLKGIKMEMISVAYLLEHEISEITSKYFQVICEFSAREEQKFEIINQQNQEMTENFSKVYTQKMNEKLDEWKILHHSDTVSKFIQLLNSSKFINPEEREEIFRKTRENQTFIYNLRTSLCREVCESDLKDFSQAFVEGKIEHLTSSNEKAQEIFDQLIRDLMSLQEVVFKELEELFDQNKEKILYIHAYDEEKLLQIINTEFRSLVDQRKREWQDLTKKTIKFLDENDARSQEVAFNLLNFVKSIGQVADEQQKRLKEEEQKYSNDLAKRGDQLDEDVEKIEEKFNNKVEELKRTVTPGDLEKSLQECIAVIEEIASENRKYTEDASETISKHSLKISANFLVFLTKILEKFGIFSIERKDEVISLLKVKKSNMNNLKTPDEAKRRLSSIKDIQEVKVNVEVEEVEILGKKWIVHCSLAELAKDLLVTDEDKEKENAKRLREEEKRKEEEKRMIEEQQKKEELKKMKGKPSVRVEDVKKEEIVQQLVQELEIEEDNRPMDPFGNLCLLDSLSISASYFTTILTSLQQNFSQFIKESELSALNDSKSSDSSLLNSIREELDEKLRFLWPRKGKLEVNEFSNRSLEIKRHHSRWDRFLQEMSPKKDQYSKDFSILTKEINENLLKYKKEQDAIRLQLPKSTSIAEFQGLMRKSKDLEMTLFQKGSEIIQKLEELSSDLPEKLINSCEDYLNNLILFEKGGDFDEKEVEYYRSKAKIVQDSLQSECNKRRETLESLKKKFETDRLDPVRLFEKDYGNSLEGLAAKEGIGKKYGAPKRTAQEKIRAEMTKCEKAQEGIEQILQSIHELVVEFQENLSKKSEFYRREPSLCIAFRKLLISFRICCQKYGNHVQAFKDENLPNIKTITWKEDQSSIGASIEEVNLEAMRLEILYEPLQELAISKNPGNFTQKIAEIEKNAREESLKLYAGKALPDAVDRYYKLMKYYAEEFRTNRCKVLRETCLKLLESLSLIVPACLQSLQLSFEFQFQELCEKIGQKFEKDYLPDEKMRKKHSKALRPNLSNPSCALELETLNSNEIERFERVKSSLTELISDFSRTSKEISESFRIKIQNNSEVLLYLFDVFFIYDDFSYVPGDEAPEVKRSHIKQLMSKKKTGKSSESGDFRGKKKNWNTVVFSNFGIPGDLPPSDLPAVQSYKGEGQKLVIVMRNKTIQEFSIVFEAKVKECLGKMKRVLEDEENWNCKWKESVESLKRKND
jgi:hypothetical protein